jgi:hypothetical protein
MQSPLEQVAGETQFPQLETVLEFPQLSFAVTPPHCLTNLEQNVLSDSAVQLKKQVPSELQVYPPVQLPQLETVLEFPQLSIAVYPPHCLLYLEQNSLFVSAVQLEVQAPFEQPYPEGQEFPHEPQLVGLVSKFVSHPFTLLPSQFPYPEEQTG